MKSFFEWYTGERDRLRETPAGRVLVAAGYDVWHGGGGLLLWMRPIGGGRGLLVSCGDAESGDLSNPEPERPTDRWFVSVLDEADVQGDGPAGSWDGYSTVEEAMAVGEGLARGI